MPENLRGQTAFLLTVSYSGHSGWKTLIQKFKKSRQSKIKQRLFYLMKFVISLSTYRSHESQVNLISPKITNHKFVWRGFLICPEYDTLYPSNLKRDKNPVFFTSLKTFTYCFCVLIKCLLLCSIFFFGCGCDFEGAQKVTLHTVAPNGSEGLSCLLPR